MANGKMHTLQVSDDIWELARSEGEKVGVGPATFLRNLHEKELVRLTGRNQSNHKPDPTKSHRQSDEAPPRDGRGKAIHQRCYKWKVKKYLEDNPGAEPPWSTPIEARIRTICPHCQDHVTPGENVVMTTMSDWE